jgi:hypothetical protein
MSFGDMLPRMAISKEEADLLRKHLAKYNKLSCPICGKKTWSIDGPVVAVYYNMDLKAVITTDGIPMVVLTCLECWFVRQFALKPILNSQVTFALPEETDGSNG